MEYYLKYLNTKQQKCVKNYMLINNSNFNIIKKGDYIKYIIKKNLKFRCGGYVFDVVKSTIFIKNRKYHYVYPINLKNHIILHLPHKSKLSNRDFMQYLLNGLENNTIKVTKSN